MNIEYARQIILNVTAMVEITAQFDADTYRLTQDSPSEGIKKPASHICVLLEPIPNPSTSLKNKPLIYDTWSRFAYGGIKCANTM